MPTYEYECKKCGHLFEEFQRMSDEPLCECPRCSGSVSRLPGRGAGIIFKGSGFYATDYRSSSYRQREKDDKRPAAEKSGKKDEKKEVGDKSSGKKDGGGKKED
jgi:putative FmdB family regulatory protein